MLVDVAKSAKLGQNEVNRFPLKEIFSTLSALSGLVPNYDNIHMIFFNLLHMHTSMSWFERYYFQDFQKPGL